MKKYLYNIVLATLILLSTTVVKATNEVYYTNKNNIEMTEKEYNNLLGLGFTEKQIARMDEKTFLENRNLDGEVLSETGKYIKTTTIMRNGIKSFIREEITKEEAMAEKELQAHNPNTRGAYGNYYDGVFATSVIYVKNKIVGLSNTYMRFMTTMEWLTIPDDRYNDIIGIGIEPLKVQMATPVVFREDWRTTSSQDGYTTVCSPKSQSTGGSAIFSLPSGSLSQLEAYLYFNVAKQDNVGTITELYTSGNYAHAYSNVSSGNLYNHYTVSYGGGISIDSTYGSYYDTTTPANASFIGSW